MQAPEAVTQVKERENSLQLAIFADAEQNLIILDSSSLSRAPPPHAHCFLLPFRFTSEAMYAVFLRLCMLLRFHVTRGYRELSLSHSLLLVSLFMSFQAMMLCSLLCFFRGKHLSLKKIGA